MALIPRNVFDEFGKYMSQFTVETDEEIEDQLFDRKEIRRPATGNVPGRDIRDIRNRIKETVSGFANSNPDGGLLVVGISKQGVVVGINHLTDDQRNDVSRISDLLRNQSTIVRWQDCTDNGGNENRLLLIYVPETTDAVCETIDSTPTAWKRAGAQNLVLTDRDREQLRRDKQIYNFERRQATNFVLADVNDALLTEIKNTWPGLRDISRTDTELLREFGAIDGPEDARMFTNAGLLFFSSNPQRILPSSIIRILRYEAEHDDSDPGDPTLDKTFSGSIATQLLAVREYLQESGLIRVYHVRSQDGGFEEIPELPFIAVDEAVVNAVAHRDYALEWPIECTYFRDAFVVRSPGRLLQRNGRVPESFSLDERSLQSMPRNPTLMNWLKQSKDQKGQRFVRALSEGTRAMLRAMTEASLQPPEYKVTDAETIVTLRIDTSRHAEPEGTPTEYANLFEISSSGTLPRDWRLLMLATLRDKLRAGGWFVDRMSHGRMTAHVRGNDYPLPQNLRNTVRLFPAYVFAFREFHERRYLVIDYTVVVKSLQNLSQLQHRGHTAEDFVGRWANAKTSDGWRDAKIEAIGGGNAKISIQDLERTETVDLQSIIPSLSIREIIAEISSTSFDLHSEIKRRSLSSIVGAARQRAEKSKITAEALAESVFPLRVGVSDVSLASEPVRLGTSKSGLSIRSLPEPLVEFGRHQETSNIREGITEFGAYSHDTNEIELIPIISESYRVAACNLIERLKTGKFKYKGGERTFGTRFTYGSMIGVHESENVTDVCKRVISEHPDWVGDAQLKRLFLVHTPERGFALDDEQAPYYTAKRAILQSGIPCQMIDTPTIENLDWKDLNLALNIAAKCGVVPWVLPEGFPDADFFVGLSYTQHRGKSDTRFLGYACVFNEYGRWLFYSGNAETFPYDERTTRISTLVKGTLERLDGLSDTPHIYFHYSARFSHDDRKALVEAARRVRPNGTYSFVSINTHHPIRLYDERPESDGSIARGAYVVTSKNQIYVSTTGYNPYRKSLGTPVPLEITVWTHPPNGQKRSEPDLHGLARQILALTKLNWASSDALVGEPITTKYAGSIAYLTAAFMRQGQPFKLHPVLERTPWFL